MNKKLKSTLGVISRSVKSVEDIGFLSIIKWGMIGAITLLLLWGFVVVLRQLDGMQLTFN